MTLSPSIVIGYTCRPKKKIEIFNEFTQYCHERYNIKVIEIDLNDEIITPVDIYLCKVTDYLNANDEISLRKLKNLQNYLAKNPRMLPIETIDKLEPILTRERMCETFQEIGLDQPGWMIVNSLEDPEMGNISFPIIVKMQAACGSDCSHMMALVFDRDQLPLESFTADKGPFLVQQFVNHDAKVYKIFVIGKHICTQIRDSFPNYEKQSEPILFHSQHLPIAKTIGKKTMDLKESEDLFLDITQALRKRLNVDLFGVDVIVDGEGRKYIIDFNFFPGYIGVEERNEWILEVIEERYGIHLKHLLH